MSTSPSGNAALSPSFPDWLYLIKIVISSTPSSGGRMKFLIVATIPELCPLTLVPFPLLFAIISLKYTDTSTPKWVEFIFAEK